MESPPSSRDLKSMGAIDARTIVPVQDAHGGVTIYYQGSPHPLPDGRRVVSGPSGANRSRRLRAVSDGASRRRITRI